MYRGSTRNSHESFGYTAEEVLGQWLPELIIPEELRAEALKNRDRLISGNRVASELPLCFLALDNISINEVDGYLVRFQHSALLHRRLGSLQVSVRRTLRSTDATGRTLVQVTSKVNQS
jgi:PAS domain-containing protein